MPTSADEETKLSVNRNRLGLAIEALRSTRDGDRGVAEVIAHGKVAIPFVRELLFEREPSGLFETRRRAVEALALLGAQDALIEFLESSPDIADPVERLGEDAVVNAAARALRDLREPRVFQLLLSLVKRKALPGLVAALGRFRRPETIPYLIDALAEDESRPEAEAALREMASFAKDALIAAALQDPMRPDRESQSRLRQRRSALALLVQTGVRSSEWPALRNIMKDQDAKLIVLACQLCLSCAPKTERREAIDRLRRLLPSAGVPMRLDIERCLAQNMGEEKER
jgi:hypothetical protein